MLEMPSKLPQQNVNVIRKVLIIIITYVSISLDMLMLYCAVLRLSFKKSSRGAKCEFERLWGDDIQGYHSVHIDKQIPIRAKL